MIKNVGVKDELTGKIYSNHRELCKLLNETSEKSDENAEKYYDCLINKKVMGQKLEEWLKVLNKHGIHSAEKLDLMLTVQKVW